jgi:hypothetical protein
MKSPRNKALLMHQPGGDILAVTPQIKNGGKGKTPTPITIFNLNCMPNSNNFFICLNFLNLGVASIVEPLKNKTQTLKYLKCKVPFLLLILLPLVGQSQNLVPNPSFEEYTECPDSALELDVEGAYPWTSFRQTPDFFHPCDETGMMSSPNSISYGFGIPYHGAGKGGFIAVGGAFDREILGVQLEEPLIIGESYFVSFYLLRTFGGGFHANCNCASNNIGLKFTTQSYSHTETVPIDNFAHILHEDVLSDTTNWTEVSGGFVADSAYTHLAIGTFFTNEFIIVENYNNNLDLPNTYYFIDAVCVTTDPAYCDELRPVGIEATSTSNFQVFPNPTSSTIQIKSQLSITELRIYDVAGKLLLNPNSSQVIEELNISHLAKGLYVLVVQFENGAEQSVSFIKQ